MVDDQWRRRVSEHPFLYPHTKLSGCASSPSLIHSPYTPPKRYASSPILLSTAISCSASIFCCHLSLSPLIPHPETPLTTVTMDQAKLARLQQSVRIGMFLFFVFLFSVVSGIFLGFPGAVWRCWMSDVELVMMVVGCPHSPS